MAGSNEFYASYSCPVLSSPRKPIPLIVIGSMHPNCHYEWICIEKRDHSCPDTPVLYVNEPNLYKCSVATKKKKVFDITFDVSYVPAEGLLSAFLH